MALRVISKNQLKNIVLQRCLFVTNRIHASINVNSLEQATARIIFRQFSCLTVHLSRVASYSHRVSLQQASILNQLACSYSKSKSTKKGASRVAKPRAPLTDLEMLPIIDVTAVRSQIDSIIDQLKQDFIKSLNIRSGIGIDQITVDIEGAQFPMREVASITRSGSNIIRLDFSAVPEATKPAYNAIVDSGMNVNPQMESTLIYLTLPKITREHRERLAKGAKNLVTLSKGKLTKLQSASIAMINDKRQESGVSEELVFKTAENIRYIIALAIEECDRLLEAKTKELLE